jgi:hypothetical protein
MAADKPSDLVQDTLDMLILKTLAREPMHGYGIAVRLEQMSRGFPPQCRFAVCRRLPVATVIENLEDLSVEEVMEQFDVTREQIAAVLDFVAQSLKVSAPAEAPAPVDARSL